MQLARAFLVAVVARAFLVAVVARAFLVAVVARAFLVAVVAYWVGNNLEFWTSIDDSSIMVEELGFLHIVMYPSNPSSMCCPCIS